MTEESNHSSQENISCDFAEQLNCDDTYKQLHDLQSNEIKLLEQVKSYVSQKITLDQEYCDKLTKLHSKFDHDKPLLNGSQVNQAWNTFMQALHQKNTTLSESTKTLKNSIIPNVQGLITRKKHTLSMFDKRETELTKTLKGFKDEVERLEGKYKEHLKEVARFRKKMDDALTKNDSSTGKITDQLENASRKLHLNHNDYVLAMTALNEYEKFYRNDLNKYFLNTVQKVQKKYVEYWKDLYTTIFTCTDYCSEDHVTSQHNVKNTIELISSDQEYITFVDDNKKQVDVTVHKFPETIIDEMKSTGLKDDTLALNDLTMDGLGCRLRSCKDDLTELNHKINSKKEQWEKQDSAYNEMMEKENSKTGLSSIIQYNTCSDLKMEWKDLESRQSITQTKLDLITLVLASAANGIIPSYRSNIHFPQNTNIAGVGKTTIEERSATLPSMKKNPPLVPTMKPKPILNNNNFMDSLASKLNNNNNNSSNNNNSNNNNNNSNNKPTIATKPPPPPPKAALKPPKQRALTGPAECSVTDEHHPNSSTLPPQPSPPAFPPPSNHSSNSLPHGGLPVFNNTNSGSVPVFNNNNGSVPVFNNNNGSIPVFKPSAPSVKPPRHSYEQNVVSSFGAGKAGRSHTHPPESQSGGAPASPIVPYNETPRIQLEMCPWFHGSIDRPRVKELLKNNGDFLVREKTDGTGCVLSLKWDGEKHFVLKQEEDGMYKFESSDKFQDIPSLINHHYENEVIIQTSSGARLISPVSTSAEFLHSDIQLRAKLGSGNFGDVYQGNVKILFRLGPFFDHEEDDTSSVWSKFGEIKSTKQSVAVKTCKGDVEEQTKRKFLNEAGIMRPCNHENVLKLIGISKDIEPYYIILELCMKGDLQNLLKREGVRMNTDLLFNLTKDCAKGMQYLESMQIIHRDLAARNCLVTKDYVVKISDFGMSREKDDDGIYEITETKKIPIKWSAPEVWNKSIYSSKSDVWSFGVLVWEIFAKGQTPYAGWDNKHVCTQVDNGYRLQPPIGTPPLVSKLMEDCWMLEAKVRPGFTDIVSRLNRYG